MDFILATTAAGVTSPLVSFALILGCTRSRPRPSAVLSLVAIGVSTLSALLLLSHGWFADHPIQYTHRWYVSAGFSLSFGFLLDPPSLLMFTLVAVISLLVQIYSLGYMAGDPGFSRYYAFQSLFAWSMLSLTISSSLLQVYIFWELVGLCSYLLIGFWYERFSATQAGKKALVMTRVGDVAFLLGVLTLLLQLNHVEILQLNRAGDGTGLPPALQTLSVLLIFGGIVGKSAQFPLLTWLPDAMEGPTPVSALLHSATMVAAGAYLFARLFPFFHLSPEAMSVCLGVGALSMLAAGTMAMVERDIKRIWAYSTISQLGTMLMGFASGGYFAGTFHLTTHAAFKALLFLCAGIWIHRFDTNDIYELARRNARDLKIPMLCTVLGGASLAGIPPLSGFFSKEQILSSLLGQGNPIWLLAGIFGVFLTAYYTFRSIFILFFAVSPDAGRTATQGKNAHGTLYGPVIILAFITAALGFCEQPIRRFMGAFPMEAPGWLSSVSLGAALLGVVLTWWEFGRKGAPGVGFVERVEPLKEFFLRRWFLDEVYQTLVRTVVDKTIAVLLTRTDRGVIDGGIDGFCRLTVGGGRLLSHVQSGLLRSNLLVMLLVLIVVGFYLLVR
ncbi:MAG: NADH-quinone oxidoreductase subunit L [Thermodesulfobacteriota bacterium]